MIKNGFVYAVNKSLEKTRKKEERRDKKMAKLTEILKKKKLQLAINAKRKHFNKTELKLIDDLGFTHYLIINEKFCK